MIDKKWAVLVLATAFLALNKTAVASGTITANVSNCSYIASTLDVTLDGILSAGHAIPAGVSGRCRVVASFPVSYNSLPAAITADFTNSSNYRFSCSGTVAAGATSIGITSTANSCSIVAAKGNH